MKTLYEYLTKVKVAPEVFKELQKQYLVMPSYYIL